MRRPAALLLGALAATALVALVARISSPARETGSPGSAVRPVRTATAGVGIHKIRHVVVIMQENRSFDSYFGTYPGADGIPMRNGIPSVCVPDPLTKRCDRPFHDSGDRNYGGPHGHRFAVLDVDQGRMDGFIDSVRRVLHQRCLDSNAPICTLGARTPTPDVIGYHDAREIPNYWAYARDFVLQDHMLLGGEEDIEVVAEASNGLEAVEKAARYDPTVVLMDIRMLFNDARRDARFANGTIVLLAEQDRSLWDAERIAQGRATLDRALVLGGCGPYVLQAAIAALHLADHPETR